jgi:hypothetical protein
MNYSAKTAAPHGDEQDSEIIKGHGRAPRELGNEITEGHTHVCAPPTARGPPSASETRFLGSGALCARYGVSRRTLARWIVDPPSGFPASIVLRGRHLWRLDELEAWERSMIAKTLPDKQTKGRP